VQQTLRSMGPWFDARSGVPARSWLRENPVVASVISVATILTVGPAIAGIIVAIVAAGTGASLNPVVSLPAMGLVVGLLVGVPLGWYAVRRWRRRRLAGRWWHYVIPPARLEAAARVPGVGERLTNLAYQIDRLRGHPAVRGGWVPGVDADTLGRFHFTLASELLGTLDLRNAVAEAATHPNLAAQASARQADLAAADQAFDAQLGYLHSIRRTADTINGRLEELALAERLDAGGPTMAQLRAQLSAPAGTDLAGLAGAATEAARLVTEALDPRRLYRPGT